MINRTDNLYPEPIVPERIVERIKDMIACGELKPGERINQRRIAEVLGITTTPLREALGKLEMDGTLKRINGLGVFVRRYTREEVRDLYLMRGVLEGLAARLCAERASDAEIAQLETIAKEIDDLRSKDDYNELKAREIALHEMLAHFSGSTLLEEELKRAFFIRTTIARLSGACLQEADLSPEADHGTITAAIRARDGARAEEAMKKHVANGLEATLSWLEENKEI
ncbi:MAG: GntR family transcriptional regulator [Armatimonadota bacterium]